MLLGMHHDKGMILIKQRHPVRLISQAVLKMTTQCLIAAVMFNKTETGEDASGVGINNKDRTLEGVKKKIVLGLIFI